ncbi:MAG: aminoacyl-tRNA hydrolase [Bacteroidota bacterium]
MKYPTKNYYLIVGLGNIGPAYDGTRHNVGFQTVDHLAEQHGVSFEPSHLAYKAVVQHQERTLHIIKPTTYMNHSGKAVRHWLNKLQLPVEHSLIVVDDIALPFGKLRLRMQGTHAGHNGLKSIEAQVGTRAYPRLRIGIGNNFAPDQQADYVLAPFKKREVTALPEYLAQACEMVCAFSTLGIQQTMAQYN